MWDFKEMNNGSIKAGEVKRSLTFYEVSASSTQSVHKLYTVAKTADLPR